MSLERIESSYDIPAAKAALEQYAIMRMKSKTAYLQLASFCEELPQMYNVIKPEAESRGARLGIYAKEGETVNEAVVRYQGVLFAHDLPPVTKKTKIDDKGRRFLSQSISVTGFGCDSFQRAHHGGIVVAEQLGSYLADDSLPSWKAKPFHEYDGMQASNRYFSYKKNNNNTPVVPFARTVDPFQTLSEMAGDDYEHTQDNEVEYLVCLQSAEGKLSYRPKDPATFLAGDIVEVQVSLAVFKTREGKKMLNPVLRGVTLLSDKFSKAARIQQMKLESRKNEIQTPSLKRKIGYECDDEDVDYARKSFKQMSISP